MEQLAGKVAVVTGGGSGIGRAISLAFAAEGMAVAVVDVEAGPAEQVAAEVRATGARAMSAAADVADRAAMRALARRVDEELGGCDVLCNNAGVLSFKHALETSDSDWDWQLGVNLIGVINGIQAFLPAMVSRGGGHIVNTASIAGMAALGGTSGLLAYTTSKYAVVGLSEALAQDLADHGIGVSVLCPGGVATRIGEAGRNRPERFGGPEPPRRPAGAAAGVPPTAMDPAAVAALVVRGIRENRLHIFTHPETKGLVEARCRTLRDAFDWLSRGA